MVASAQWGDCHPEPRVSIPFIAGQWSLRLLRCTLNVRSRVSIPFIAGQWSLLTAWNLENHLLVLFQSPSLRGSGRFMAATPPMAASPSCFNPLHCGAVVASRWIGRGGPRPGVFQSPSLRGSGRFAPLRLLPRLCLGFQSPSLRGSGRFPWSPSSPRAITAAFQSPSLRGSGRFRRTEGRPPSQGGKSFNPLHCGAVVASQERRAAKAGADLFQSPSLRGSGRFTVAVSYFSPFFCLVSIPFIAGQWSLRLNNQIEALARLVSIPFIAGQWSLQQMNLNDVLRCARFNPLHCGAVVASLSLGGPGLYRQEVSIPFIAGQWSLRCVARHAPGVGRVFQSPSLRGSGRFRIGERLMRICDVFQSPSLRGSGRFPPCARRRGSSRSLFQSPSLRGSGRFAIVF